MTLTLAINGSLGFVSFKHWGESDDDGGNRGKRGVWGGGGVIMCVFRARQHYKCKYAIYRLYRL